MRCIFLQWIPWALRMGRPGEKITRKTIMMQNKMKELDLKERSSKSLLANVLDMDDDFRYFIWGSFYRTFYRVHSHIAIVVRPPGRKTLCRSLVICKGFFRPATPAVIWRVFQFCKEIWFGLWSCYLRMAFLDGDNFCKAFAGALVNMSYHSWLRHSWYDKFTCAPAKALQKLSPSRKTTLYIEHNLHNASVVAFYPFKD